LQHKIQVYHFHNGSGGGVLSVIRNLLRFSVNPGIENHIIYTINKDVTSEFLTDPLAGAISEKIFYYSPKWNFYYTCRQLAKLLPNKDAVVIAHDWLELGMMSNLGLQNPLVLLLHGDYEYYYQLATLHEKAIDRFICIAQSIQIKLTELLPQRKNDMEYNRFPVPEVKYNPQKKNKGNIIFIGRLTAGKGYTLLPVIAKKLSEKNIDVTWHIVGIPEGTMKEEVVWDNSINVHFYKDISNDRVLQLLAEMELFILPSLVEGMPVTVVEAMKAGVIPLVNNINGGIQELVENDRTGYKISDNNVEEYAKRITELIQNENLAEQLRKNCIEKANALFDPYQNTKIIEDVFASAVASKKENKIAKKTYGSRLDQLWLPNSFTQLIRKIR